LVASPLSASLNEVSVLGMASYRFWPYFYTPDSLSASSNENFLTPETRGSGGMGWHLITVGFSPSCLWEVSVCWRRISSSFELTSLLNLFRESIFWGDT